VKSVLYYVMPKKIINGTLFYAMEYFLVLNEIEPTQLILRTDEATFSKIMEVFSAKYNYDKKLNEFIIFSNYTNLLKIINDKVLILDTNTYIKCKPLIRYSIFLYSENGNNEVSTNTYGYYNYQKFNRRERLKLGLKYHKKYEEKYEVFRSSLDMHKINGEDAKKPNTFMNLMEYKTWKYVHNGFDTNNRFVIEARYFNKELIIDNKLDFDDSIQDRLQSPIEEFILDASDSMIQDFLKD